MVNRIFLFLFLFGPFLFTSFSVASEKWAFAQDMDGTVKRREYCRKSLADVQDNPINLDKIAEKKDGTIIYDGDVEVYRIFLFDSKKDCDKSLSKQKRAAT